MTPEANDLLTEIIRSPNITIILIFLVLIGLGVVTLSKNGLLSVHTNILRIGAANDEREIIWQQVAYVRLHCLGLEATMPKPDGYDHWRGKYVAEKVYDEYVDWITFNHITTDESYIKIKQDRIVSLVRSLTERDEFHSEEFEQFLRDDVKKNIEAIVQIREVFGKGRKNDKG